MCMYMYTHILLYIHTYMYENVELAMFSCEDGGCTMMYPALKSPLCINRLDGPGSNIRMVVTCAERGKLIEEIH